MCVVEPSYCCFLPHESNFMRKGVFIERFFGGPKTVQRGGWKAGSFLPSQTETNSQVRDRQMKKVSEKGAKLGGKEVGTLLERDV